MGSSQTSTQTQNSTSTYRADPQARAAIQPILSSIPGIVNTPYSNSMDVNVAGQNPQQLAAIQAMGGLISNNPALSYYSQAADYSRLAADPNNVNAMTGQYYTPMASNVLAQLQNVFGQQNAQLKGNQAASGAIGGSRSAVADATLANQHGLAAGSAMADLYNRAQQAALTTAGQQQGTAYTLGALGGQALNAQLQGYGAALQGGNQLQQQQQNIYDAATQNAIQETLFPQMEAAAASNIAGIGGMLGGTTTGQGTSTTTVPVNYLGSAIGGGLGLLGLFSDERVKENIREVGKTHDGQPIYKFNYKGDPTTHMGLLAQEVEHKHPEAVGEIDNIKTVNYDLATKDAEKHRAIGGGVGLSNGLEGIQNFSGLSNNFTGGISSGLMPFLGNQPRIQSTPPIQPQALQMPQQQQGQVQDDPLGMKQLQEYAQKHPGAAKGLNEKLGNTFFGSPVSIGDGGWATSTQPSGGFLGGLSSMFGFADGGRVSDGGWVTETLPGNWVTETLPSNWETRTVPSFPTGGISRRIDIPQISYAPTHPQSRIHRDIGGPVLDEWISPLYRPAPDVLASQDALRRTMAFPTSGMANVSPGLADKPSAPPFEPSPSQDLLRERMSFPTQGGMQNVAPGLADPATSPPPYAGSPSQDLLRERMVFPTASGMANVSPGLQDAPKPQLFTPSPSQDALRRAMAFPTQAPMSSMVRGPEFYRAAAHIEPAADPTSPMYVPPMGGNNVLDTKPAPNYAGSAFRLNAPSSRSAPQPSVMAMPTVADIAQKHPNATAIDTSGNAPKVTLQDGTKIIYPAPKEQKQPPSDFAANIRGILGLPPDGENPTQPLGTVNDNWNWTPATPYTPTGVESAAPQPAAPAAKPEAWQPGTPGRDAWDWAGRNILDPLGRGIGSVTNAPLLHALGRNAVGLPPKQQTPSEPPALAAPDEKPIQDRIPPPEPKLVTDRLAPSPLPAEAAPPPPLSRDAPTVVRSETYRPDGTKVEGQGVPQPDAFALRAAMPPQIAADSSLLRVGNDRSVVVSTPEAQDWVMANASRYGFKPVAESTENGATTIRLEPGVGPAPMGGGQAAPPLAGPTQVGSPQWWGRIPHTPRLAENRAPFVEALRNDPQLRERFLAVSLNEQNHQGGNLSVFETAMNRARMAMIENPRLDAHTALARELRWVSEKGYYADGRGEAALRNPAQRAMAEHNLEYALNGSNRAGYMTDNSSEGSNHFSSRRFASGMYTPEVYANGEYYSYPSNPDARGYRAYPQWLESVGGTLTGKLTDITGETEKAISDVGHHLAQGAQSIGSGVTQAGQQFGRDVANLPGQVGSAIQSAYDRVKPSRLDAMLPGIFQSNNIPVPPSFQEPQGLGGIFSRMLGIQGLPISQGQSNALVNLGAGMMAAGPSIGKSPLGALTNFGAGLQYGNKQDLAERTQAVNLYDSLMQNRLRDAQAQRTLKPEWQTIRRELVPTLDPATRMYVWKEREIKGWVNPFTQEVIEPPQPPVAPVQNPGAVPGAVAPGSAAAPTPAPGIEGTAPVTFTQADGSEAPVPSPIAEKFNPADPIDQLALKIISGQAHMPTSQRQDPRYIALKKRVYELDPSYTENRSKFYEQYGGPNGRTQQAYDAFGTAMKHAHTLDDANWNKNVTDTGIRQLNAIPHAIQRARGNSKLENYDRTSEAYGNEHQRTLVPVGPGTGREREEAVSAVSAEKPRTGRLAGNAANVDVLLGKMLQLDDKYNKNMGLAASINKPPMLASESRAVIRQIFDHEPDPDLKRQRYERYSKDPRTADLVSPPSKKGKADLGGTSAPASAAPAGPKVGEVQKGYRFKGGDPRNKDSWEKVTE